MKHVFSMSLAILRFSFGKFLLKLANLETYSDQIILVTSFRLSDLFNLGIHESKESYFSVTGLLVLKLYSNRLTFFASPFIIFGLEKVLIVLCHGL